MVAERNMLAREKREMLRHMDKMAKENASLLRKISNDETKMIEIEAKSKELMVNCRKLAEENTQLHLVFREF
ncbi:hypothetical protein AAMO2058_001211900 [Amorphochlora amoebiformis]